MPGIGWVPLKVSSKAKEPKTQTFPDMAVWFSPREAAGARSNAAGLNGRRDLDHVGLAPGHGNAPRQREAPTHVSLQAYSVLAIQLLDLSAARAGKQTVRQTKGQTRSPQADQVCQHGPGWKHQRLRRPLQATKQLLLLSKQLLSLSSTTRLSSQISLPRSACQSIGPWRCSCSRGDAVRLGAAGRAELGAGVLLVPALVQRARQQLPPAGRVHQAHDAAARPGRHAEQPRAARHLHDRLGRGSAHHRLGLPGLAQGTRHRWTCTESGVRSENRCGLLELRSPSYSLSTRKEAAPFDTVGSSKPRKACSDGYSESSGLPTTLSDLLYTLEVLLELLEGLTAPDALLAP